MKFPVNFVNATSTWYLRSANGTKDGQATLAFGETEDTLFAFGRQEIRYKYANETLMIMDNDTVIMNNSIARLNAIEGKYEWGFNFGNYSYHRYVDMVKVDVQYITNTTGPDIIDALIFVYGNKNFGRILIRENKYNTSELFSSIERGQFLAVRVLDYNRTNIILRNNDGMLFFANVTFDTVNTTFITYKRVL